MEQLLKSGAKASLMPELFQLATKKEKKTLFVRVDEENFEKVLQKASEIIKKGGTVAFPTETVYGLGANGLAPEAVKKIFEAKKRPSGNPLSLLVHSKEEVARVTQNIPEKALKLMEVFWPGPLTLVLEKAELVPALTSGNLGTIGVRMPDNPVPLELIKRAGVPLAAPSANLSGRPSPSTAAHVRTDLEGRIDMIIDGGSVEIGLESTVLDLTDKVPTLLRPGAIGLDELEALIGKIKIGYQDSGRAEKGFEKKGGQKYGHYTPKTPLLLVEGKNEAVFLKIAELVRLFQKNGQPAGLLLSEEGATSLFSEGIVLSSRLSETEVPEELRFVLGPATKPAEAAKKLFEGLRSLEEKKPAVIIADGAFSLKGPGRALLNRLREAATKSIEG